MIKYVNVIIYDEDRVLMQLRDNNPEIPYPGIWCLPGGHIDKGETPKQAVIRECYEECNYKLVDPKKHKTYPYKFIKGGPKVVIFVQKFDGKQKIICKEGADMRFLSADEIIKYELFETHKELVLEFIKGLHRV